MVLPKAQQRQSTKAHLIEICQSAQENLECHGYTLPELLEPHPKVPDSFRHEVISFMRNKAQFSLTECGIHDPNLSSQAAAKSNLETFYTDKLGLRRPNISKQRKAFDELIIEKVKNFIKNEGPSQRRQYKSSGVDVSEGAEESDFSSHMRMLRNELSQLQKPRLIQVLQGIMTSSGISCEDLSAYSESDTQLPQTQSTKDAAGGQSQRLKLDSCHTDQFRTSSILHSQSYDCSISDRNRSERLGHKDIYSLPSSDSDTPPVYHRGRMRRQTDASKATRRQRRTTNQDVQDVQDVQDEIDRYVPTLESNGHEGIGSMDMQGRGLPEATMTTDIHHTAVMLDSFNSCETLSEDALNSYIDETIAKML
ncbi:MAG: hypothetical protein Q9227_009541 [Pyrenula ochraceoflavens]